MEDPWVSPWTADSPAKLDLPTPPPNAHFSADNHHGHHHHHHHHHQQQQQQHASRQPSPSPGRKSPLRTPWDEDDTWGGWNEPGRESPGWGRSPGLKPLDGGMSRLPSPDPWGRLAVLETAHGGSRNGSRERIVDSAISLGEGARRGESTERGRRRRTMTMTMGTGADGTKDEIAEDVWGVPEPLPLKNLPKPMLGEDIELPESPMDPPRSAHGSEDRPGTARSASKVQELVVMFDGMAKRTVSPIDSSRPSSKKSSGARSPLEGVFPGRLAEEDPWTSTPGEKQLVMESIEKEDAPATKQDDEAIETEPVSEQPATTKFSVETETPLESQDEEAWNDSSTQPETKVEADSPPEPPTEAAPKPPQPPAVHYPIDFANLDALFPSVNASFPSPEPVPDVIIDDTFATISERKMWYRISRLGSVRKHDLGDDENYVRVSWSNSKVREQSIRTVRRWMEEDSMGGRLVLGRRMGAAGGKIFNWDTSVPPVEISELLARRNHSRQISTASKGTVASPTAASFGWNNSPVPSPTVAAPPTVSETSATADSASVRSSISAVFPPPSRPVSVISRPVSLSSRPLSMNQIIAAPISPLGQPPETAEPEESSEEGDDDDDDWGEMVSSPTVETNGTFPSITPIAKPSIEVKSPDVTSPALPDPPHEQEDGGDDDDDDWGEMVSSPAVATNGVFPSLTTTLENELETNGPTLASPAWPAPQEDGWSAPMPSPTVSSNAFQPAATEIEHKSQPTVISITSPTLATPNQNGLSVGMISAASANNTPVSASVPDSWGFGGLDGDDRSNQPESHAEEPSIKQTKPLQIVTNQKSTTLASPTTMRSPPLYSPFPNNITLSPISATNRDDDDDGIVANILQTLPDLSYMLR